MTKALTKEKILSNIITDCHLLSLDDVRDAVDYVMGEIYAFYDREYKYLHPDDVIKILKEGFSGVIEK